MTPPDTLAEAATPGNRFTPRASVRAQLYGAAFVWAVGASILIIRGIGYVSDRYWHSWALGAALVIAVVKSRFLLDRVARKAVDLSGNRGCARRRRPYLLERRSRQAPSRRESGALRANVETAGLSRLTQSVVSASSLVRRCVTSVVLASLGRPPHEGSGHQWFCSQGWQHGHAYRSRVRTTEGGWTRV